MNAAFTFSSQSVCLSSSAKLEDVGITWSSVVVGMMFSGRETGGTLVYDSGNGLIDFIFGWSLLSGIFWGILTTPWCSFVTCYVIDNAVPWKESWLEVHDGLWSMLSRFPVVSSSSRRIVGQTMPSFPYILITLFASSVDSCKTLSYDTDKPLSKRMSMRSRLRVLLWMSRPSLTIWIVPYWFRFSSASLESIENQ